MRAAVIAVMMLIGVCRPALWAQPPEFEVASIKVNRTGSGGSNFPSLKNGTFAATNVSLLMLLATAYDLSTLRVVGPAWLDADRFDLTGKAPQGVPDTALMPMLQTLLQARFHISSHREMKEMPVYELVVAKDGLKMRPFDPATPRISPPARRGGAMISGTGAMVQLAKMLAAPSGRPVIDKTGLEGRYSYALSFTPLSAQPADSVADSAPPDLFAALQEQLGLKLDPKKAPVEVLVIDRADRTPVEN